MGENNITLWLYSNFERRVLTTGAHKKGWVGSLKQSTRINIALNIKRMKKNKKTF